MCGTRDASPAGLKAIQSQRRKSVENHGSAYKDQPGMGGRCKVSKLNGQFIPGEYLAGLYQRVELLS